MSARTASVLSVNNDLPIRTDEAVHGGKVRAVYWLTAADSARLIATNNYDVAAGSQLAVMVISDRISAFDCIWHGEGGMGGVPGKGAALNTVSRHWFDAFSANGLAGHHILDVPHPLVWIVQRTQPIMVEAIARQYITGSMWRAYARGERTVCGIELPEGLQQDQRLPELLITPSTKGILNGLIDVPPVDDVNISRANIEQNLAAFRFKSVADIDRYETLLKEGFELIDKALDGIGQIFVDTKFEFGYATNAAGEERMIYMDEVGTPDSSRLWDKAAHADGKVVENSKEEFRKLLLSTLPDPDVLLDKSRMAERKQVADSTDLPLEVMQQISDTYTGIAAQITGAEVIAPENPREEILEALNGYGLVR